MTEEVLRHMLHVPCGEAEATQKALCSDPEVLPVVDGHLGREGGFVRRTVVELDREGAVLGFTSGR